MAVYSRLINQVPKSKVAKAVVKKCASYSDEEHINVKPFARAISNIAQQCYNDPRWTRTFLPTLSHVLYVTNSPFKDWTWGSDPFRKTIQAVFDVSFPNISYTVTEQDCITKAVHVM
jgi:hypothetical protein